MNDIIVSSVPLALARPMLAGKNIRKWVFLGKDTLTADRWQGILPDGAERIDYSRRLYDVSEECRGDFIRWIDAIALSGGHAPEWFFSVPAVKNTYYSELFLNICYLLTASELLKDNAVDLIVVDSPALAEILKRQYGGRSVWINGVGGAIRNFRMLVRSVGRLFKFCAASLRVFISAKQVLGQGAAETLKGKSDLVVIRNYISGDFSNGKDDLFEKHYFPGLADYLNRNKKTPVFFSVPIQVKSYRKFFESVKKSARVIIFGEEFLRAGDYVDAWATPLRALRHRISAPEFRSFNVGELLKEDYNDNVTDPGMLRAVLFSRLGERFRENNIGFEIFINWSEFQAFEKGLIFGLRRTFPELKLIASQPFCAPLNHLSLFVSEQEKVLNIMPDKLLVLGPAAKGRAAEFANGIPVGYTPAFRYRHLFDVAQSAERGKSLLVLFGYGLANSVRTMRLLVDIQESLGAFDKVLIKIHPSGYFGKKELMRAVHAPLPEKFQFVEDNLKDYLPQVAVGLCGATGAAVELVTRGIPVVVAAEATSLTMNYLIKDAHPDLWRVCFTRQEVVDALQMFIRIKSEIPGRITQSALEFRKTYFAEPDDRNWENYLTVENKTYGYAA